MKEQVKEGRGAATGEGAKRVHLLQEIAATEGLRDYCHATAARVTKTVTATAPDGTMVTQEVTVTVLPDASRHVGQIVAGLAATSMGRRRQ